MLVCAQAPDDDPNPANDCLMEALDVIPLHWDLRLNVQAPECAFVGSTIIYQVLVANAGNTTSPNITSGLRTGICLNASNMPLCWDNNCICGDGFPQDCVGGGILCLNIPPIAPGVTTPIPVQYTICQGACCGQQVAKAGLNSCAGVNDACSDGNFDFEEICVFGPGCSFPCVQPIPPCDECP